MTFKELFQEGQCSINTIDALADIWHKRDCITQNLQDFLGLNDMEYQTWLSQGNAGLAQKLHDGYTPEYNAVYLGWDELTAQIQTVVDDELGPGYTVKLRRQECYYWDVKLKAAQQMDEALSEMICERLDLQDVDALIFLEDDWVDSSHFCKLLTKLTHREVCSSHADDYGVWIICKSLTWSTPEFTQHLLAQCERRLRQEIGSCHYRLINADTACHQLFGFKEALVMLGLLERDQCVVMPNHFSKMNEAHEE